MTTKTTKRPLPGDFEHGLADHVRTALDRKCCPGAFMTVAYEAVIDGVEILEAQGWRIQRPAMTPAQRRAFDKERKDQLKRFRI